MTTRRQRQELELLAEYQRDNGFDSDADTVDEYIKHKGVGWRSIHHFLMALRRDVWWHYGHVGDEDEKHVYEAMEARIERTEKAFPR